MAFNEQFPEWQNQGTEPSENLKTTGFQAGYKPPASVFNWFWSKVMRAVTEIQTKFDTKADKKTDSGGFVGGENAAESNGGVAVGKNASASLGGAAVGPSANAGDLGFAGGYNANTNSGASVGANSVSNGGGAAGLNSVTGDGFAGGKNARAASPITGGDTLTFRGIDAIQLGSGVNPTEKTFQVYQYQMMDANGNIPAARLSNAPATTVVDSLSSTSTADALSANQGKVLNETKAAKDHTHDQYVNYGDALLTENVFAGQKLYLSKIDNGFYALDQRETVTAVIYDDDGSEYSTPSATQIADLFTCTYENGGITIPAGKYATVTVEFGSDLAYPYGVCFLSFRYDSLPQSVTARIYCKDTATNEYEWHTASCSPIYKDSGNTNVNAYWKMNVPYISFCKRMEFTVTAKDGKEAWLTELEWFAERFKTEPFVSKSSPQTMYYSLTAPEFIGDLTGTADKAATATRATSDGAGNNIQTTYAAKKNAQNGFAAGGGEAVARGAGGAIGQNAQVTGGGACGDGAKTTNGFAGGKYAITLSGGSFIDAVQLGTGTNSNEKTFQVYDKQIVSYDSAGTGAARWFLTDVGKLSALATQNKNSIVEAINELAAAVDSLKNGGV